jgi:phage terminase large subunit GpA-like protein
VIEEAEKSRLDASGRWIRTFRGDSSVNPAPPDAFAPAELERWCARPTEGRYPGFHIWQAYNPLVSWERIVASYLSALASGSQALKPFHQQWLGKAWEEQGEAPAVERLLERRESWPTGRIPPGVLFLTGAVDVQGNRLEYAVYGWDRRLGGCLVDKGVLVGNPSQDAVWLQLDGILGTQYTDAWGKDWQVNRWAVDAGYLSSRVYMYARRHAASGRVMAVDGRPGWKLPAIGTPKGVKFQVEGRSLTAVIHPIGTWELKSEIYSKLALTVQGPGEGGVWPPGAMRFNETVDLQYLQQLTAEYLVRRRSRTGHITPEWVRKAGQANEAFDLAVYNLALAHRESDGLSTKRWDELAAARLGEADDLDGELAPLWSEEIRLVAEAPRLQPLPQHRRPAPLGRRIIHMAYHNRMRGEDA